MSLNLSILENVKTANGKTTARCPACKEEGYDKDGEHLVIYPDGRYGCAVNPGDKVHTKRIYELVGAKNEPSAQHPGRKSGMVYSTIEAATSAARRFVEKKTEESWKWIRADVYRSATGEPVAAVLRFDRADGATEDNGKPIKTYRPVHVVDGGWQLGDPPGLLPLFNLPAIVNSDGIIHINEGEKAAMAGTALGLTSTTSMHGAKSAAKTDYAPLKDRDVVIHPDNDRKGREYADDVAARAYAAGATSVKIVVLPGLPPKGDMADYVALHPQTEPDKLRDKIAVLVADAPLWIPPPKDPPPAIPVAGRGPMEAAKAGAPIACTDLGNADRLVAYHGHDVRWDATRERWRVWDGRRWVVDTLLKINALAADTARKIRQEAASVPSSGGGRDIGQELFAWAVKSEFRERLAAMLEVAKSQPGIAVSAEMLDADPMLLNVMNGTIDLRTGVLRPHNRDDLITKLAPVEYKPGCRDERLETFLETATNGDKDLIGYLQKCAGYTLTGENVEEILLLVYGPENSGKTTFLESLRSCLGDYARTIQPDLLTRQRESRGAGAASPELASLAGVRLAAGSEMEQGREMAEALAKNLTGGEQITARHLYAELFDFMPQFKIWLALNHCPKVSADDGAIWRRIRRVGFEHVVPPEARDKTLKPYLRNPTGGGPAVLAWAVEGCLRWQKDGLAVPEAVQRSTEAYRTESDPLAAFFEDCCLFDPRVWTTWNLLWRVYNEHAAEMGVGEKYRIAPKRLQDRLRLKGCTAEKRFAGRGWLGVSLTQDWDDGVHGAHGAYDGLPQTFPSPSFVEKVSGNVPYPPYPPCSNEQPMLEGDAADLVNPVAGSGTP